MAKRGGYSKSTNDEWIKTSRQHYAEAIRSADDMGQDLTIWLADAIAHHAYRCELIQARERFELASREAAEQLRPSPLEADFKPKRSAPVIGSRAGEGAPDKKRALRP